MKYPRAARITRRQDIESIRKEGRALRTTSLVARMRPSPFVSVRVGVVVPRFGHTAVNRNQLKRRLRELVRIQLLPKARGIDLVLWAQPAAYKLSYLELRSALEQLVRRIEQHTLSPG